MVRVHRFLHDLLLCGTGKTAPTEREGYGPDEQGGAVQSDVAPAARTLCPQDALVFQVKSDALVRFAVVRA